MRSRIPDDEAAFSRALEGARQGHPLGFEWLWHRFSRQISAFARLQGSEDPEGLTNDVFAAAFGRIDHFSGGTNAFVSFVFAIARNKLVDEHRRRFRRVVTDELSPNTDPSGGDVEQEAFAGLTPETAQALTRLTAEQREVVFLRLVGDLSIEEVAALTGRSLGAVKALQHRALTNLRREIPRGAVSR